VDGIHFIERMRANPANKDELPESVTSLRGIFMKSVVVRDDLPAGTVLHEKHLTTKKPGSGIPAGELPSLVGRRLRNAVDRDTLLTPEDLE
jgi:sialic acid synthase SpsE